MIKAIVTTTINPPSKALKLFSEKKDWSLIIVGDKITPHHLFRNFEKKCKNVLYLSPEDQDKKYSKLSKAIGWRKIQRRNIGYLEGYEMGADVIATVDDDNIPSSDWGKNLFLNKTVFADHYKTRLISFDPVGATNFPHLWHRGYPLQLVAKREYSNIVKKKIKADIQADFWNGDPDIDAVCRLTFAPSCIFKNKYFPMSSNKISPFNSQNTFLTRQILKHYFLYPDIGRMDDIWASFYVQSLGFKVIYGKPTVTQLRNVHDLTKDMKAEYIGYEKNQELIKALSKNPEAIFDYLPKSAVNAFKIYHQHFK